MATLGIEIVDAGLAVVRDGTLVATSPGVALIDGPSIATGDAAAAVARLRPAHVSDRYWSDLAADSYARSEEPRISHADLAHEQLTSLWREAAQPGDDAVFAVPGTLRPAALGLLLGIARHAAIPVAGLVDSAVAATAGLEARATVLHLDVQLHQAVLTELHGTNLLRRRRVEATPRAGQKALFAGWAQHVAEAMVRRTRFDPLHQAATEQLLYRRLPEWIAALRTHESVDATLETDVGSFTAPLQREQFTLVAEAWYAQLAGLVQAVHRRDDPATLALSARTSRLPALVERMDGLAQLEVVTLAEGAAAAGAAARAVELGPADPPALVTALARAHPVAEGGRQREVAVGATHVIQDGRAHVIGEEPLVVGAGVGDGRRIGLAPGLAGISRTHCTLQRRSGRAFVRDHSRYGTFVNGERVQGELELAAGDRLRVGTPGVVLELIAVN